MFIEKMVTVIIVAAIVIALFVFPSMNQPVKADQLNSVSFENMIALQKATGLNSVYPLNAESSMLTKYFNNDIKKVMAQPGCVTIRIYVGTPKEGKSRLIIVGVDKYGKNMMSGVLAGPEIICPPLCGN